MVLGGVCFVAEIVVLLEGLLALWLAWPALPVTPLVRRLYAAELVYPQYDPACARFDAELFYALRPGTCRFDSREFSTELRINSAGFRDDEASLHAPTIIAAGDSTTMGWGVAEEESYAAILEHRLGVRVLNTGVPSYGTVREMASLDRLDTSALSVLIVGFAANDRLENTLFLRTGALPSLGEERYTREVSGAVASAPYWFGKYSIGALKLALGEEKRFAPTRVDESADDVEAFLHALRHGSSVDLSGTHVIVFAIEPAGGRFGPAFVAALARAMAADPDPSWVGRLTTVDVSEDIRPELRFRLDGHIRAEAHRRIAERLAAAIEGSGPRSELE